MKRRLLTAVLTLGVSSIAFAQSTNMFYPVQPAGATDDPSRQSSRRTYRPEPEPNSAYGRAGSAAPAGPSAYGRTTAPTPLPDADGATPLPMPSGAPIIPPAGLRGSVDSIPLNVPGAVGPTAPRANGSVVPLSPSAATPNAAMSPSGIGMSTPPALSPSGPTERVASLPNADTTPSRPTTSTILTSPGPQMHVSVEGPEKLSLNREAVYRVVLENRSQQSASELLLRTTLPTWAKIVSVEADRGQIEQASDDPATQEIRWALNDVRGSQTATLTCRVVPLKNQPIDFALDWVQMAAPITKSVVVRESKLELAISGPPEALYGETRRYSIVLSNPGDGDAENVELSLSPLDSAGDEPLVSAVGTIPAGGRKEIAIEFEASKPGEQTIAATATAAGGLSAQASAKVLVRRPDLLVEASGQPFAYAGAVATYKFRVTNTGTATAKDVLAAVAVPSGLLYKSGIESGTVAEGGVRVSVGTLAPGETRDFTFYCEAKSPGERTIEIGAKAEGDLFAEHRVTTVIEAVADLKLSVNDPPGPLPVGEEIVYEVKISNRGTKAAREVRVVAQFSEGIEPVSAIGSGSKIEAGQVVFDPIASIGPTSETILKISARAHSPGHHIFRAQVLCADPETRLIAEDTTQFYGEAITSAKSPALPAAKPFSASASPSPSPTSPPNAAPSNVSANGALGMPAASAPAASAPAKPVAQPPSNGGFVPAGGGPAFVPAGNGPSFAPAGGAPSSGDFQPN